ncbi:UNVERIFIED_CONTAM: hypothetical protein K2H54_023742 [Gekko kuhli]
MNFGSKSFKPKPPDKGAFPLDHLGECKAFKEKYMKCLRENGFENSLCRQESKEYLECRMDRRVLSFFLQDLPCANQRISALVWRMPDQLMPGCQLSVLVLGLSVKSQLMAREPLEKLGFKDLVEEKFEAKNEKVE